jgi:four helix bundle protein
MVDSGVAEVVMESTHKRLSTYRDLIAWQKSVELVTNIYDATSKFPREEMFGLTSQLRRCAASVPSNVAEGQGRAIKGEFVQFLSHARGSLFELETQLLIAGNTGYLSPEVRGHLGSQTEEVARILNGLLTSLGMARRKLSTNH